jgi:hypothetical protein
MLTSRHCNWQNILENVLVCDRLRDNGRMASHSLLLITNDHFKIWTVCVYEEWIEPSQWDGPCISTSSRCRHNQIHHDLTSHRTEADWNERGRLIIIRKCDMRVMWNIPTHVIIHKSPKRWPQSPIERVSPTHEPRRPFQTHPCSSTILSLTPFLQKTHPKLQPLFKNGKHRRAL